MRSLAKPGVLARAAIAALATSLACYPRLTTWSERTQSVGFLWPVMLWATFVLWSFVFAWHFQYTGLRPLAFPRQPRLWGLATACGVAAAVVLWLTVDPQLRVIMPEDYSTSWPDMAARGLFALAFDPLFFCFAPFAFFIRLSGRQTIALVLTVIFGLLVAFMELSSWPKLPPAWLVAELLYLGIIASFLFVYLYVKGGAWLVWWFMLVSQLHHLPNLPRFP